MLIQFEAGKPLYQQVFEAFRQAILKGELSPGEKLGSSRKQATELGVSRNIVLLAYEQLLAEGYVSSHQGAGTFVSKDLPNQSFTPAPSPPQTMPSSAFLTPSAQRVLKLKPGSPHTLTDFPRFNFRYGLIAQDETLLRTWKRCLIRAADSQPLNYADAQGSPELRETLAQYLRHNRGVRCQSKNIVITSGSQQALYLVAQALIQANDKVLIEEPHYQGARQIFLAQGAKLVAANVDEDGLQIPNQTARLAYVTPSHQFPLGPIMSLSRRLELLTWAKTHQAFILEDDYDSEYRYEGRPIAAIQGLDNEGCVIYSGTFSKTLFPSLRLGFLVLPDHLIEVVKAFKWLIDRHSSSLDQAALNHFIAEGYFEKHLRRKRLENARRRTTLLESLEAAFGNAISIMGSNAGVHVVVWFKSIDYNLTDTVIRRALEQDVGVYSIAPYYLEAPGRLGLLFGYSFLNESDIQEGVRRFKAILQSLL